MEPRQKAPIGRRRHKSLGRVRAHRGTASTHHHQPGEPVMRLRASTPSTSWHRAMGCSSRSLLPRRRRVSPRPPRSLEPARRSTSLFTSKSQAPEARGSTLLVVTHNPKSRAADPCRAVFFFAHDLRVGRLIEDTFHPPYPPGQRTFRRRPDHQSPPTYAGAAISENGTLDRDVVHGRICRQPFGCARPTAQTPSPTAWAPV